MWGHILITYVWHSFLAPSRIPTSRLWHWALSMTWILPYQRIAQSFGPNLPGQSEVEIIWNEYMYCDLTTICVSKQGHLVRQNWAKWLYNSLLRTQDMCLHMGIYPRHDASKFDNLLLVPINEKVAYTIFYKKLRKMVQPQVS